MTENSRNKERAAKLRTLLADAAVLRRALETRGYTVEIAASLTDVKVSRHVEEKL